MLGHIDFASLVLINGWACGPASTKAEVEIFIDGHQVGAALCNQFRSDLLKAKISDGYSGFSFSFPRMLDFLCDHDLAVRVKGSDIWLLGVNIIKGVDLLGLTRRGFRIDYPIFFLNARPQQIAASRYKIVGDLGTNMASGISLLASDGTSVSETIIENGPPAETRWAYYNIRQLAFSAILDAGPRSVAAIEIGFADTVATHTEPGYFALPTSRYDDSYCPPEDSIERVVGPIGKMQFITRGLTDAGRLVRFVRSAKALPKEGRWLDWGCGAGRIAVPLQRYYLPDWTIIGVDVDTYNLDIARHLCPEVRYESIGFLPPLKYPDNFFDVVHGLSVMTHLTEDVQAMWLSELHRVLKRGGIAIFTTHGELSLLHKPELLSTSVTDNFITKGFSAELADTNLGPLLKQQELYRATFQSRDYTCRKFSELFQVVKHIGVVQDYWVLRKAGS